MERNEEEEFFSEWKEGACFFQKINKKRKKHKFYPQKVKTH